VDQKQSISILAVDGEPFTKQSLREAIALLLVNRTTF
jgi:hypothetical protein